MILVSEEKEEEVGVLISCAQQFKRNLEQVNYDLERKFDRKTDYIKYKNSCKRIGKQISKILSKIT